MIVLTSIPSNEWFVSHLLLENLPSGTPKRFTQIWSISRSIAIVSSLQWITFWHHFYFCELLCLHSSWLTEVPRFWATHAHHSGPLPYPFPPVDSKIELTLPTSPTPTSSLPPSHQSQRFSHQPFPFLGTSLNLEGWFTGCLRYYWGLFVVISPTFLPSGRWFEFMKIS
jgi:hypothetical protein